MKVIGRVPPQLMPGGRGQAKVARKHTATAQKAHQVRGGKAVMKLSRPAREIFAESYLLPYTGFLRHFGRTRQFWTVESNSKYARCRCRERGPIRTGTDDDDDGEGGRRRKASPAARGRRESRSSHHFPFITRTISATLRTNTLTLSFNPRSVGDEK